MNTKKDTRVVGKKNANNESSKDSSFSIKMAELQIDILEKTEAVVDDGKLARAKLQWYLGDWQALASMEIEDSNSHQYGILCLMKAAGLQQTGDLNGTLEYATLAKNNNVDNQLLKQILVGGLFHTLGRIHAIKGDYEKAKVKISKGISLVKQVEDTESGILSRFTREVSSFGNNDLALGLIKNSLPTKTYALRPSELANRLDQLTIAINSLKLQKKAPIQVENTRKVITPGDVLMNRSEKVIIVIAGMRHSGSTLLFNIIRVASELSGLEVKGDFSERINSIEKLANSCQVLLIKTHEYRDDIAEISNFTLTTIRDLRETVASAKRRNFYLLDKVGGETEYAKYNRSLHDIWRDRSDLIFEYEKFMESPFKVIKTVLAALELDSNLADEIYRRVTNLPTDKYDLTLFSDTHITDPKRELDYTLTLEPNTIIKIEQQHQSWLEKYGYKNLPV